MGDDRPCPAALDRPSWARPALPGGVRPALPAHPILIGLGGNLDSPRWGPPQETLCAALAALETGGVAVVARSAWYRSEPVPRSDQPWFVNAVAAVETGLSASELLELMQAIETRFGRVRSVRNAARAVDLDLLDYRGARLETAALTLPHPRLHQRRFVLQPLDEIAPGWRHPRFGTTARQLLAGLDLDQRVERLQC
jgi:2-amino-4-hydroxy-6-hydroxymethyldihydropteridine diphosphokinase